MKKGIELIADERQEQIDKHGRTVQQDVLRNSTNQLSWASTLLNCPEPQNYAGEDNDFGCPEGWDVEIWTKMIHKPYNERLVISGALIAAEIDRLNSME